MPLVFDPSFMLNVGASNGCQGTCGVQAVVIASVALLLQSRGGLDFEFSEQRISIPD
jgi:hypothetical protein